MLPEHISFGAIDAYYAIPGDSTTGDLTVLSPGGEVPIPMLEALTFRNDFKIMYFSK